MNTMGNSRQLSLKYVQKCPAWVPTRLESLWLHSVAKAQRRAAKAEKVILQARQYQNLELNSFQHQQELINYVAPLQAHRILEEPNMDSEVRLLQLAAHVTAGVADLFAIQWSDAEMGEKQSRVSNWWQMHATSFMISLVTSDPKNILRLMLFGRFLFCWLCAFHQRLLWSTTESRMHTISNWFRIIENDRILNQSVKSSPNIYLSHYPARLRTWMASLKSALKMILTSPTRLEKESTHESLDSPCMILAGLWKRLLWRTRRRRKNIHR